MKINYWFIFYVFLGTFIVTIAEEISHSDELALIIVLMGNVSLVSFLFVPLFSIVKITGKPSNKFKEILGTLLPNALLGTFSFWTAVFLALNLVKKISV